MKHLTWLYAAVLCILFLPVTVRAEESGVAANQDRDQAVLMEMDIDELRRIKVATVTGASKYEQKVTEAPASVTLITADEIRKYGYRTLADILRSVRGLYVIYDRNYAYVGVRGFGRTGDYSNRILLLVDGHRTNDNIFTQGFIGTDFILDVDLIDRVEIIRGPGSSLYGSNAFFGVVNVITRSGRSLKGFEASGEAAGYGTHKGRASYGTVLANGAELLVSGSLYDSDGQRLYFRELDDPATNNGISEKSDYDRNHSFFAKASSGDLTLEGGSVYRKKGIPTGSWGTIFNDPRSFTVDERAFLELKFEHDFSGTNVASRLSYDRYSYYGDFVWDAAIAPPPNLPVTNKDSAHGDWVSGELKFTKTMFGSHKASFGAEFQNSIRQDQRNYDEEPYSFQLDDKRRSRIQGLYLQDEFGISKNLNVNAGVRYDHYDSFGGTTNPRVALLYNPAEQTTVKAILGRAFRAPSAYELYWHSEANQQKTNPDLKPETIKTYELVLEQYFKQHLRGSVSAFYNRIDNLINLTTDTDFYTVYRNIDSTEARGGEAELEGKWGHGVAGRISYTVQKSKNRLTGEPLANSPRHLAKLNITAPLAGDKLFAGVETQYSSMRKTNAGNELGGFFITNATVFGRKIAKELELSGSVYNVFDKQYSDPASEEHVVDSLGQDGRSYRVKATYRF